MNCSVMVSPFRHLVNCVEKTISNWFAEKNLEKLTNGNKKKVKFEDGVKALTSTQTDIRILPTAKKPVEEFKKLPNDVFQPTLRVMREMRVSCHASEFHKYADWDKISRLTIELDDPFIKYYSKYFNWNIVSASKNLDEDMMRTYPSELNWKIVLALKNLSSEFLTSQSVGFDDVDWKIISKCQIIGIDFAKEFAHKLDWVIVSKQQTLCAEFIEACADYIDWPTICMCQTLNYSFIEKYSKYIHWDIISRYQTLPNSFVEKHKNKLDIKKILVYQKTLSRELKQKLAVEFNLNYEYVPPPKKHKKVEAEPLNVEKSAVQVESIVAVDKLVETPVEQVVEVVKPVEKPTEHVEVNQHDEVVEAVV